ncbi:MAG TPA: hypothetical protein VF017_10520 [Thermoanaerobaculia bacterium]|nr:hypothetical protein [Thermoanaerobaculia bacterium]
MPRNWTHLLSTAILLLVPATAHPQAFDLAAPGWELKGEGAKLETTEGRAVLALRSGFAYRRDVALEDGTIEFDMKVTGRRSFAYLQFRMESDSEYEEIYFRPHKTRLPDSLQYNPVYQRAGNWQLYHGPESTAAVELAPDTWLHVRLVLEGQRAALFLGDAAEPVLLPRLARPARAGYFALRGFLPPGEVVPEPPVRFTNVVVKPGVVGFDFAKAKQEPEVPLAGAVQRWKVSPAFVPAEGPVLAIPTDLPPRQAWATVAAEPSAQVVLARHVTLPPKAGRVATAAAITLRAAQAGVRRFDFAASDEVSVFLNGRLLYTGDQSYSFNFPRRDGLLQLGQEALYLPLEKGDNDLVLVVSEVFGGWGLSGRIEDRAGLEISP